MKYSEDLYGGMGLLSMNYQFETSGFGLEGHKVPSGVRNRLGWALW